MVGSPIGNSGGLNLFFYNRFHLFVGYFYAKGLWLSKNQVVGFTYRQPRGLNLFFYNRFHLFVGYFLRRACGFRRTKWSILPIGNLRILFARGLWLSKNQVVGLPIGNSGGLNLFFDNRFHLYVGYFLRRAKWSILPIDTFGYIALKDDLYP